MYLPNRIESARTYSWSIATWTLSCTAQLFQWLRWLSTRKVCYRKDDRAMRPIHGCPENVVTPDSLTIIPNIFPGLLFQSTLWMFLQNLKSVDLPVLEIIGGTQKFGQSLDTLTLQFSPKFLMGFYLDCPCKCIHQIWSS